MSRSLLLQAFAEALGRKPTDHERNEFMAALSESAGGEYLYIPKLPQSEVDPADICMLRDSGMSYREIASQLHCSQATIASAIRQRNLLSISPYDSSAKAA